MSSPVAIALGQCDYREGFGDAIWRCRVRSANGIVWVDGSLKQACYQHWRQLKEIAVDALCNCPSGSMYRGDVHEAQCRTRMLEYVR